MDGPGGGDGAGGWRLRDPQHFDPIAPGTVVHAERQPVAVGIIGQPVDFKWHAVAVRWPAGHVRQPVCWLRRADVQPGRAAGIVRRCNGFFIDERVRRLLAGSGR